jgi:site-specific DNA-methyltransferase (adenine-specific)
MKKFDHPAMFPMELPKRCIKMFSYVGDTVLDLFSGLGTTCKAAKNLNRKYIGFETDEKYFKNSLKRLRDE